MAKPWASRSPKTKTERSGFRSTAVQEYPLLQGLTDVAPRLEMMTKGKIALAALDPSTQLLGYDLQGEQAESWCRIYNECVKEFLKKYPERFTAMAAVPNTGAGARSEGSGTRGHGP